MIEYKTGNLLNENAEALINTVNCVGVMGCGLALQFKKAYPENFKFYLKECQKESVVLGKVLIFQNNSLENPK